MAAAAPRFSALLSMFPLLLCVFCTFGLHSTAALDTNLPEGEVEALRKINAKLKIGWDFSVDPCSWQRGWLGSIDRNVTCDCNETTNICHVVLINLKSQNLTGVLPEELGNLTKLYFLDLSRNYINGTIPAAAWASLPLIHLGLLGNRISGRIPKEIRNISTLQELILENNLLRGRLPRALGRLKNLTKLTLSGNYFIEEIPDSLANLKSLTDFRIDGTNISGRIPAFIGNWTKLVNLYLQGTSLEGPFPPTFSKLKNIVLLRVSDMKSDGVFPNLKETLKLKELILRNCSLYGEIPTYLWSMPELKILDLSFNHLTGKLPDVQVLRKLDNMYLTNNMLDGKIPDWITRSKNKIDLSYNNFTGSFPPNLCQRVNLNLVAGYSYSVKNSINSCSECSGKRNYNMFINCGGNKVVVEGNEYEEDTQGSGDASALFHISQSKKWALSSTGSFFDSSSAKYIATIQMLNMSNPDLYLAARLSPSSLKYYGLCLQKGNYTVKLHFAETIFTSDQTFSSLGRRLFDVSIQGQNVLKDFNIAVEANGTRKEIIKTFVASVEDTILEIHFQWAGKGTTSIPSKGVYGPLISAISVSSNFPPDSGEHRRLSVGSILGIVAASIVVILLALLFLWFCTGRKYQDNNELKRKLQASYFSLSQIKSATANFDPANKIGEGGFGPVYKGLLPDGSLIAVKQLSSKSRQGNREFVNEIGMISALQHPNLVKLLGCCIEGNQLLLIYEFMENNSLARALFGPEEMTLNLDWQTRCKICLDIARGLAYLHEESRLKIVHRDIKATNILLDKNLNAKISDFGLAKLDDEEKSHITTRIAGTKGYMAPEYAMRGQLTDKADVYSFGVVMLEIISGKAITNYQPEEKFTNLLDRAYVLKEQGTVLDLVDPRLGANYSKEEAQRMLDLALTCTNTSPTQRPTMSTVVSMLEGGVPAEVLTVKQSEGNDFTQISSHEILEDMSIEAPMTDSSTTLSNIKEESTSLNPSSRSV